MYFPAPQTPYPSRSALGDHISASDFFTTSEIAAYEIPTTMSTDVSLMSSSPKPTGIDFDIEDEPGIDEGSGSESNLSLILITIVTLSGKCMEKKPF